MIALKIFEVVISLMFLITTIVFIKIIPKFYWLMLKKYKSHRKKPLIIQCKYKSTSLERL